MSEFYVRRVGNALLPDGDESVAAFAMIPFGKPMRCELKQPRNLQFHKLFWALCSRIASGLGRENITSETVATMLKLATGHFDLYVSKTYGEVRMPKSVSFAKMDGLQFREFFERCVKVVYDEWGIDPSAVADLLAPKTEMR